MLIRPYMREDLPEVKGLHQLQGFDYELPDLDAKPMLVRSVIEEHGRVTHAVFLRKTCEAFWIFNPAESKRERLGKFLVFSKELLGEGGPADRAGFEDLHAFLPPKIVNEQLHRTLLNLGWEKPLWPCYSRKVR